MFERVGTAEVGCLRRLHANSVLVSDHEILCIIFVSHTVFAGRRAVVEAGKT
jgi:hypothetical protein